MTSQTKILWVALIAVAIIALGGYVYPEASGAVQGMFGGTTNVDEIDATAMKIGGANGSRLGPVIAGTCSLVATSFTVAASTTVPMDCVVTGVVSGDIVDAWFATSSVAGNGWTISGSSASSTNGNITLRVSNFTGTSNIIPASLASSTPYIVLHPLSSAPGL